MTFYFSSTRLLALEVVVLVLLLSFYLLAEARELAIHRRGKLLILAGAFALPLLALYVGVSQGMQGAEQTKFCLSCHEMEPFHRSLFVDETDAIPAVHYQNRFVSRDIACYDCHRDYTLFGTINDKIIGVRHIYVHFSGHPPSSEKIKLYKPFPNMNCLHCHGQTRKFDELSAHNTKEVPLAALYLGKISCGTSGCHDSVHLINKLKDEDFWKPEEQTP